MSTLTRKNRCIDMIEGSMIRNYIAFAIPLILTNILQQLYKAADSIIVGKFAGSNALAAVGICGTIYATLISLFLGLSGGTSVLVAQKFGERDYDGMSKTVHTSYAVAIAGGIMLTIAGILSINPVFGFMNVPGKIIGDDFRYVVYIYIGIVPAIIYNFGAGILRSVGDSRNSLIFLQNERAVAEVAKLKILILVPLIGLYAAADALSSSIRGCGKSLVTMIISVVCICILRIAVTTVGLKFHYAVETAYFSYPILYVVYFLEIITYYVAFKKYWIGEKIKKGR